MLTAQGQVTTEKAQRYLKALCNHFSHKVQASYDENQGHVEFGFGVCDIKADANILSFELQAEDAEGFERVKFVVADHLERFSGDEALKLSWT
jgi:hypothetical protein